MARLVALQLVAGQQLESVTADHGLALGDYLVLAVIRRSPDGVCAPSTVCEVLRRASGGMTLTLDRLESAGWLSRAPGPLRSPTCAPPPDPGGSPPGGLDQRGTARVGAVDHRPSTTATHRRCDR